MVKLGKIIDFLLMQALGVTGKTDFADSHKVTVSEMNGMK